MTFRRNAAPDVTAMKRVVTTYTCYRFMGCHPIRLTSSIVL